MHTALISIVLVSAALAWQPQTAERDIAHQKLDFLVGEWTARIEVDFGGDTSPLTFPAEARFEWALGDTWLRYTFSGEIPDRGSVEILSMINYVPSKHKYNYYLFDHFGSEAGEFWGDWTDEDTFVVHATFEIDGEPTTYQRITWKKLPEGRLGFALGFSDDGKEFKEPIRGVYTRAG